MMLYKGYELTVGLEVHVELKTESKIYCSCPTAFGDAPNTNCCPVCMGMPGALPVLNRKVPAYAAKAGFALNCRVSEHSGQDRKNYFYPDLPKGYQISQYERPLCADGYLDIETASGSKRVEITRIHIEEDAGKLIHGEDGEVLIDCNRCGVPLIEIVTAPVLCSAEEAKTFLQKLRTVLLYLEISDCKMNEGSMRCDVNLSVHRPGTPLGQRTEIKNLNSFAFVAKAIEYEYKRQVDLAEQGCPILFETMRFDEKSGRTESMRQKESAKDYRFFPDPDLPSVFLTRAELEEIRKDLPLLPHERTALYRERYGISDYDCSRITSEKERADYFEAAAEQCNAHKILANLVMEELSLEGARITPSQMAQIATLLQEGRINTATARKVIADLAGKEETLVSAYVFEKNLWQITDKETLRVFVKEALAENPTAIRDFGLGKKNASKVLVGFVMKKTAGRADAVLVEALVLEALEVAGK